MPKTILVVDDEDGVRESVREVLNDEGYRVIDTADGTQVLDIIKSERPDLVLLDIWMPQIDGIGLLKEIKIQEPDINVVMVSGHGNIHTAVTATKFGAFDFIEKPVSLDGLLLTVQRALGELPRATGPEQNGGRTPESALGKGNGCGAVERRRCANDQTENFEKKRGAFRPGASFRGENRLDSPSAAGQQRHIIYRDFRRCDRSGPSRLCRLDGLRDFVALERICRRHR